jgi:hypothetical protein
MGIAIFLDLFRRNHNDIHRLADTEHIPVNLSRHTAAVIFAPFDDQQIYITIRSHLSTCCRTEKDNLLGLNRLYNSPHDLLKDAFVQDFLFSFHYSVSSVRQKLVVLRVMPLARFEARMRNFLGFYAISQKESKAKSGAKDCFWISH